MTTVNKAVNGQCPVCGRTEHRVLTVEGFILYKECLLCTTTYYHDVTAEVMEDEIEFPKQKTRENEHG